MAFELPRRFDRHIALAGDDRQSRGFGQHRLGNGSWPQQADLARFRRSDGRFQTFAGGAFIQHHAHLAIQAGEHMFRARRADAAAAIGRRRGEGATALADQRAHRGMRRQAQRDRRQSCGHEMRQAALRFHRQDQRQRAGPKLFCEHLCNWREMRQRVRHVAIRDMDDERVEARPALGAVNGRHRMIVGRIGRQPIDGFGRNGDGFARADEQRRFAQRLGAVATGFCGIDWICDGHDPRDIDPGLVE